MSKKQIMIVGFVLDESGSMSSSKAAAISGTNEYVNSLKKDREEHPEHGEVYFTLTTFSSGTDGLPRIRTPYNMAEILEVGELNETNYKPDGGTPLLEAIGKTIEATDSYLKGKVPVVDESAPAPNGALAKFFEKSVASPETDELEYKVVIVVQTDGGENTSSEDYRPKSKIQKMIEEREARGNWTFVFLGADINATSDGMAMGMAAGNTYGYRNTQRGTLETFSALGATTNALRASSVGMSKSFGSELRSRIQETVKNPEEVLLPETHTPEDLEAIAKGKGIDLSWKRASSKRSSRKFRS